mgnify:CR=1 FL=1
MKDKINCHCWLYNKKLAELDVKSPDVKVSYSFLLSELMAIRQTLIPDGHDEEDVCKETCYIYFKTGDSVQIDIPYKQMDKTWQAFID